MFFALFIIKLIQKKIFFENNINVNVKIYKFEKKNKPNILSKKKKREENIYRLEIES